MLTGEYISQTKPEAEGPQTRIKSALRPGLIERHGLPEWTRNLEYHG